MQKNRPIYQMLLMLVVALVVASCSTTRRIADDELLYTGVKRFDVIASPGQKVSSDVDDQVKNAIDVAPNNSLISPYLRYPFPIGLWVYNNWDSESKGFKHWLYEKLVEEPVLVSDVRPEVRVKMIDQILDNNGYFSSSVSYELLQGRNKKKAKIKYIVNAGPEYALGKIELLPDTCHLNHMIDSIAQSGTYLVEGNRYCTDSLSAERTRIANAVRNRGYYYFRPDYIEYLADSTLSRNSIALKMVMAKNIAPANLKRYRTGFVTVRINRNQGDGTPDTIETRRARLILMQPSKLRTAIIPECVTFRANKVFSVRDMNRTQTYLSRLGIFNAINIDVQRDTVSSSDLLNVDITCTFDTPLEASIEVNASSKSNSYLGPGMTLGVTNRNLFGGGEQLNVNLTGAYEWQTGRNKGNSSLFNSYEVK